MKPRLQSSCSCTTCRYGSESSLSSKRLAKGATRIDKLFYDKYLPLRERKLIDKLVRTRAVYDDIRKQVLSRTNVLAERGNTKPRRHSPEDGYDDFERSIAISEIVSLVDKGDGITSKLSECCSCCTCGSESQTGVTSKRANEDRRHRSRGVQFKHTHSDPCTCTLRLLSKQKVPTSASKEREAPERLGKDDGKRTIRIFSNLDEGARKSVKKIHRTTSKIKEKSMEKLKQAKHGVKEKLDTMQTQYVKRHETEDTVPIGDLGMIVKKDSITKFREKLKRRKLEHEFECEQDCSKEECDPEECFEKLNLRSKLWKKPIKTPLEGMYEREFTMKEKGFHSPRINIEVGSRAAKKAATKLCTCTLSLRKSIKSSMKLNTKARSSTQFTSSTSADQLKNISYRKRKLDTNIREKKRRTGTSTRHRSASSGTSYSVSTVRKTPPRFVRAEKSAPNVSATIKETGSKTEISQKNKSMLKVVQKQDRRSQTVIGKSKNTSTKYGLRRCVCKLKLTASEKVKEKKGKETSNQEKPRVTSTSAETNTNRVTSLLPYECEPGACVPDKCDPFECLALIKKRKNNIEKRRRRHQSSGNRILTESRSSVTPRSSSKAVSLLPYECPPGICMPDNCDPYECLAVIKKQDHFRKRNRRHQSHQKRSLRESKSSVTPAATPHRTKKVQSSMFAYKTEVQTQYNNSYYKNNPDETNRIQEISRISGLPSVKLTSSFSFNIEISKKKALPINDESNRDHHRRYEPPRRYDPTRRYEPPRRYDPTRRYEPPRRYDPTRRYEPPRRYDPTRRYEPPRLELVTKETMQLQKSKHSLRNKKKGPKKVNKGTYATTKSRNRIKCICTNVYKKTKERPMVHNVSTSTGANLPPANVTKATETKITKISSKIMLEPYECEPHTCVPGQCDAHECLIRIKRRNQQFSKETGTTIDQSKRRTSSSFTDNLKVSEKAIPAQARVVKQPTIAFQKEARRPAILKHTSGESKQPARQAVKVGSSFSFSIEFSKNKLVDPASSQPFKEKSVQFFENNHEKKVKTFEANKHKNENRLKRCFCTLKLKSRKAPTNVFALNKLVIDKKQSHVCSTIRSQLSFFGSRCSFNFKDMQSYFNENQSLYKPHSFHGSGGRSVINILSEVNLTSCYTFSEACCIKKNKKMIAMNYIEDLFNYRSYSTILSRSDVTGVSSLLKRCFCTMNIRIQDMNPHAGRRYRLKSYECEPGVCVPGDCNPYDCQKLIQKRLMRKSSKMSGANTSRSRSISSNTFGQSPHTRGARHQAGSQGYNPRQRRGKPASGIQYTSIPNKSHKQAVRIGSKFSFDIEFSKDKLQPRKEGMLVSDKRSPHMRSKPVGGMHRGHRTEGTSFGPRTSSRYLQSGILTRDMYSNTDKMLKRCFCTLKLQKNEREGKYHDQSNYVAMKDVKRTPSMSSAAQNTKAFKPTRPKRALQPHECEPGVCVPGQCDPYECLERIKKRHKNTRDFGVGLGPLQRSASSITSKQRTHKRERHVGEKPSKSITSTITRNERASGKRARKGLKGKREKSSKSKANASRQAVRIGSSFNFDVEFFKDKTLPEAGSTKMSPKSKMRTSSKSIGQLKTNIKGRGAQGDKGLHHKDSQASTLSKMKSTMTNSILKRCFCTSRLLGVKNVPTVSMQPAPRKEFENIQTEKIKSYAPISPPRKLEPHECPPGTCVPAPGQCDPHECLRKINRRKNKSLGTDVVRSKSSYSSFTPLKQGKERNVQHYEEQKVRDTKRPRDTRIQQKKCKTKIGSSMSGDSKKQAVRIGSMFSFSVEFYKEKSPSPAEIAAAARRLKQMSQKTGSKDYKRHRGSGSASTKTCDQMSQISGVMTDRGIATLPEKRCFCTLKLQKRSQFDAETYERKPLPSATSRGMMTRSRHGREKAPGRRHRRLKPYECEPGVCVPGQCDPNECLLRIQRRPMRDSQTNTLYRRRSSVSSLASMGSTASQGQQHGRGPPRTKSARLRARQKRARKLRKIPAKQAVRIGSSYSFNIEFYKERSNSGSNVTTKAAKMHEGKNNGVNKGSWHGVGSKAQGSQDSVFVCHRDSQSLMPKMRSSMTNAQFLKRCFCTLKLQKSNKNFNPPVIRSQKVYMATMHNLSPYECEPGFCIPNQCDPYKCEKRIKQRMKQSKVTEKKKPKQRQSKQNQRLPKPRANNADDQMMKSVQGALWSKLTGAQQRHDNVDNNGQTVKIGSKFDFNIEFFKSGGDVCDNQILDNRFLPTTHKIGNTVLEKGKHVCSQVAGPKGRNDFAQVQVAKTQSRCVGPLPDSCFCTLKLQKLSKHQRQVLQNGKVIQTSKNIKAMSQASLGYSKSKGTKKEKKITKDLAVTTQTKKSKLLSYECEPGVCTPGLCDPTACLERIKRRQLRNFGTSTKNKKKGKYVEAAIKSKCKDLGTVQLLQPKAKNAAFTASRQSDRIPSRVALSKETKNDYKPHRQAVHIGSNFSFNVEFHKDRPYAMKEQQQLIQDKKTKNNICTSSKACNTLTRSLCSAECQHCTKTGCKYTDMGTAVKRCFCTLKLQKQYHSRNLEDYKNNAPWANIGLKLETQNKKTATKALNQPKSKIKRGGLLPYECEPSFCTPGQCDPYACLERIKQRNKTKKVGTGQYEKSVLTGHCPGPYNTCTKGCQTSHKLKKRKDHHQATDSTVEERRFEKILGNQQGVRYGSNIKFDIEFYKERLPPDFSKLKAAKVSDVMPIKNEMENVKAQKYAKQMRANKQCLGKTNDKLKVSAATHTQLQGIKLEHKGTAINTLKRCFCTLNLPKSAFKSSNQKVVTVNRVTIEDTPVPFRNNVQDNVKVSSVDSIYTESKAKRTHTKLNRQQQECRVTEILYPYKPKKYYKNMSKTFIQCENMCLKKSCSHSIAPKGKRLTAKNSQHTLKVRKKSSMSKFSGLRAIVSRCQQIFFRLIKSSKTSTYLKNKNTFKVSEVGKLKSIQKPTKYANELEISQQSKLPSVASYQKPTNKSKDSDNITVIMGKKSISKTNMKCRCKRENAVINRTQPLSRYLFNKDIICSYCQVQYENDNQKLNEWSNKDKIVCPKESLLVKKQVDNNKTLDHKQGCVCSSMCKCEKCAGDWHTMLSEQRETRRSQQKQSAIDKWFTNKLDKLKKNKPGLKPLQRPVSQQDSCARCCRTKNHIEPRSVCQGREQKKAEPPIKGPPVDASTDICNCESPCPCTKCHRYAIFSKFNDNLFNSPKPFLKSDYNCQINVTKTCLCANVIKHDNARVSKHTSNSQSSKMQFSCQKSPEGLKLTSAVPNMNETGPSKISKPILKTPIKATDIDKNKKKIKNKKDIRITGMAGSSKKLRDGPIICKAVDSNLKKNIARKIKHMIKTEPRNNKSSCCCQRERAKALGYTYKTAEIDACPSKISKTSQTHMCENAQIDNTKQKQKVKRKKDALIDVTKQKEKQACKSKLKSDVHYKCCNDANIRKIKCSYENPPAYFKLTKAPQIINKQEKSNIEMKDKHSSTVLNKVIKSDQLTKIIGKIKNIFRPNSDKILGCCPKSVTETDDRYRTVECTAGVSKASKTDQINISKTAQLDVAKNNKQQNCKSSMLPKHVSDSCTCKMPCICPRSVFIGGARHTTATKAPSGASKLPANTAKQDSNLQMCNSNHKLQGDQKPTHKHRSDLYTCKIPSTSQKASENVTVKELSCGDFPSPYRYLLLTENPGTGPLKRQVDLVLEKNCVESNDLEKKEIFFHRKRERKTQAQKSPNDLKERADELIYDCNISNESKKCNAKNRKLKKRDSKNGKRSIKKTRSDQTTQMKNYQDLNPHTSPCSYHGSGKGNNVLSQKYFFLCDNNPQNVQIYDTTEYEAKHKKNKKEKQEREAKRQKREMGLQKNTQTLKPPSDPCSCKFPCACDRTPVSVNVKEFSCNDNVAPQKYLILSNSPELGHFQGEDHCNVGYETAKYNAKNRKQERKKLDRKIKKLRRDKRDQSTQMTKHPTDPCSCRFPCPCQKNHKNVTLAEFACNDWPAPQKYMVLSDTLENYDFDAPEAGHDTLKQDKKRQKFLSKLKRDVKKKGRDIKTQVRKPSSDFCTCKFPCTCQKPHEKFKVSELACSDFPSPQRYIAVDDNFVCIDPNVSEIGHDTLKQDRKPKTDMKKVKSEYKKQYRDENTQIRKHSKDMCTCKFPCSCPPENIKFTELVCNDWPSPQKFLLVSEKSQTQMKKTDQTVCINGINSKASRSNRSVRSGILIHNKGDQMNDFVTLHINKQCSQIKDFEENESENEVGDECITQDIKNLKRETKKVKKETKNHKHRSGPCTCELAHTCQKKAKLMSELSCGDSVIPYKYITIQDEPIDCRQITNSSEGRKRQLSAKVVNSGGNLSIQNRQRKNRSALCTCKLPYPCEKCTKENILEFSGGDWPSQQKHVPIADDFQPNPKLRQIDHPDVSPECTPNICLFDSPVKTKKKKEKHSKLSKNKKKEVTQQTPKDRDDLCICPFPCTCQMCPKIPDVTEFTLDDWPSPRRCLFIDDNEIKKTEAAMCTHKYESGAKFELFPRAGKKIKSSTEKNKIGNFFKKQGKDKLSKLEQCEAKKIKIDGGKTGKTAEMGMSSEKNPKDPKHTLKTKSPKDPKQTIKNKKKIKKSKHDCTDIETQTQMEAIGDCLQSASPVNAKATKLFAQMKRMNSQILDVSKNISTKYKWLEGKCKKHIYPNPCICSVPECKKELEKMRNKKKIIPEKKCKCGVPTCEEKTKIYKAKMLKAAKSKKPMPIMETGPGSKSKKASDSKYTKSKSKSKSKQSKSSGKSDDKDKSGQKITKKSRGASKLESEFESKSKKSKNAKGKSVPESKSKFKKTKFQAEMVSKSKKSKLQAGSKKTGQKGPVGKFGKFPLPDCLCSHICLCAVNETKAKVKAKAKAKTKKAKAKSKTKPKPKPKKKPKKPAKKKKKKVVKKPRPSPFMRCYIAINRGIERRRRRAVRRRNLKKAIKTLKKGKKVCGRSAVKIKHSIASTPAMRSLTNTLESHYVSNFILHATNPKKRFTIKTKKEKEPMDFECSLFMGSLRRRPWLWVYYTCPWFYPHCISFLNIWKQFTDVMLFLLAVGVWSPCILAVEICRAFMCCTFCTG